MRVGDKEWEKEEERRGREGVDGFMLSEFGKSPNNPDSEGILRKKTI